VHNGCKQLALIILTTSSISYGSPNFMTIHDTCRGECIRSSNVKINAQHESSAGSDDGKIELTISGVKNYKISWTSQDNIIIKERDGVKILTNLKSGTYCYKIETEGGCYVQNCIMICPYIKIGADNHIDHISNCEGNNGILVFKNIKINGGNLPYKYFKLDDEVGNDHYANISKREVKFTNLHAGKYVFGIVDKLGCTGRSNDTVEIGPTFSIEIKKSNKTVSNELVIQMKTNIKNETFELYRFDEVSENETIINFNRKLKVKTNLENRFCFAVYGIKSNCRIDTCYQVR